MNPFDSHMLNKVRRLIILRAAGKCNRSILVLMLMMSPDILHNVVSPLPHTTTFCRMT